MPQPLIGRKSSPALKFEFSERAGVWTVWSGDVKVVTLQRDWSLIAFEDGWSIRWETPFRDARGKVNVVAIGRFFRELRARSLPAFHLNR